MLSGVWGQLWGEGVSTLSHRAVDQFPHSVSVQRLPQLLQTPAQVPVKATHSWEQALQQVRSFDTF